MAKKHANFFSRKKDQIGVGGSKGRGWQKTRLLLFFFSRNLSLSIDSSMYMKVCYFSLAALELASLAFVDVVVSDEVFSLEGFEALAEPEVELVGLVSIAAFWGVAEP